MVIGARRAAPRRRRSFHLQTTHKTPKTFNGLAAAIRRAAPRRAAGARFIYKPHKTPKAHEILSSRSKENLKRLGNHLPNRMENRPLVVRL